MQTIRRSTKISCTDRKLSVRNKNLFPRHMREDKSDLIVLLEAYYRWMEQDGGVQRDIYCLLDNKTSQNANSEFLNLLADQFLGCLPRDTAVDRAFLIQHVVELYRQKGTEEGIKLFFRIVYGVDPEILYPNEFILKASDGVWIKDIEMKIEYIGDDYRDIIGTRIFGSQSGAYGRVENAFQEFSGGTNITVLRLSQIFGTFYPDEIVRTLETDPQYTGRVIGLVGVVKINSGGLGYTQGESIPLLDLGDGIDFVQNVETVDIDGAITQIRITNTGADYIAVAPTPDIGSMSGTGADFEFFVSSAYIGIGRFDGDRGLLSSSARLQDGRIYQEFSYIIKSDIPLSDYIKALKCTVHPAGFFVSGIFVQNTSSDDINNGPVLFHLDQPDELNSNNPSHPNPSKFIEHKLNIDTNPMKLEDYVLRDGLSGDGVKSDQVQNIEHYLDRDIADYFDIKAKNATIPGIETFEHHDTFQDTILYINPWRLRFDEPAISIESLPLDSLIEWHFDELSGEWRILTHREKHVYSDVNIIIAPPPEGDFLLMEGGDPLLMEGGDPLELEAGA